MSRSVRVAFLGVAAACLALAGCASNGPPASGPSTTRSTPQAPQRSSRGNPPFYEVFGKRYHVLDSSAGYRERGVASWYGSDFHGKPTSGGERYDMHAMTAAHKTLPIPTWVEVTNLENGKSIVVRINDRGPFVDNRIIDLSYRAAQELDVVRNGTARVQVRALEGAFGQAPATTTAAAEPPSRGFAIISEAQADTLGPGDGTMQRLFVQVGAFADRDNAAGLVARLTENGIRNGFIVSGSGRDTLHRVRIGPLASTAEFDRVTADLRAIGIADARLVAVTGR